MKFHTFVCAGEFAFDKLDVSLFRSFRYPLNYVKMPLNWETGNAFCSV